MPEVGGSPAPASRSIFGKRPSTACPRQRALLHRAWTGELTAEATFTGRYETLYDQAGLILRVDATRWIKCGIELTDGAMHQSVVVTDGRSWAPDEPDIH